MIFNILSIAGSDPSGGAGIQADIKTFSALGGYGMAAVTALTAQSTVGVAAVEAVSATMVVAQIDALFADVRVDAVKVGMLATAEVAEAVADALSRHRPPVVVVDPVMVSTSGQRLLDSDAVAVVIRCLLPLADLITPNLPEAAVLLGDAAGGTGPAAADEASMAAQAQELRRLGAHRVLLKGGHLPGSCCVDVLVDVDGVECYAAPRVATTNDHGTGCTLSSAIAALRPRRRSWHDTITDAKAYLSGALAATPRPDVGRGHGPVHHFWALWPPERPR